MQMFIYNILQATGSAVVPLYAAYKPKKVIYSIKNILLHKL